MSNDVLIRLVADVSGLNKELDSVKKKLEGVEKQTDGFGKNITSTFKKVGTIVAGALAVDKLVGFGKECLSLGAYVEEMENKFNVVFATTGASMDKWAGDFANAIGRNKTEIKDGVANLGDLLTGYGMTEEAAGKLSQQVIALSYDLASFNNVQDADAIDRMTKGILGEHEGLKALGIAINETTLQNKMMEMGLEGQFAKLDEVTKAQVRYAIMLDQTKNAQGDAERSADSYTNKMKRLSSQMDTVKETIGGALIPFMSKLLDKIQPMADKVQHLAEVFKGASEETGSLAKGFASVLDEMGLEGLGDAVVFVEEAFYKCSDAIKEATEWVKSAVQWFKEHETVTMILASTLGILTAGIIAFNIWLKAGAISMGIVSTATTIWNTVCGIASAVTTAFGVAMAFLTSPIGIITLAIAGLVAVGILLWKNWDTVKEYAIAIWEAIKQAVVNAWEGIVSWVTSAVDWVSEKINSAWEWIKEVSLAVWEGIKSVLCTIWDNIKAYVMPIFEFIRTFITAIWQGIQLVTAVVWTIISGIILAIWNGIKVVVETTLTVIKTIVTTIWNGIKSVIETVLNVIKTVVSTIWNAVKSHIETVLNTIKSIVSTIWNNIKSVIETVLNTIKTVVTNIWNGIKSTISGVVDGVKSLVSTGFNWVKDKVSSIFNGLKSSVMGIWNGIGKGIQGVVNGIIKVINGMVRAMNKISFDVPDWVPVMGGKTFGFNIPTISEVSWFASGGIIKGTEGGTIVGVGEAGDEAIVPLSNKSRMLPFAKAVADMIPDHAPTNEGSDAGVNISIGSLVVREEADVQKIAQELFRLQERNRRRRGVVNA